MVASTRALEKYSIEMLQKSIADLKNKKLDHEDKLDDMEVDPCCCDRKLQRQKDRIELTSSELKNQEETLKEYLEEVNKNKRNRDVNEN